MTSFSENSTTSDDFHYWLRGVRAEWQSARVRWLTSVYAGGTPSKNRPDFWEGGDIPWLGSGAVNQKLVTKPTSHITELGFSRSSAKWIEPGSLVMALAGQGKTRGTVAEMGIRATCNQSMAAIDPLQIHGRYLFWWLEAQYKKLRGLSGEDIRDGLNLDLLKSVYCPKPPLSTQKAIAATLDRETARIDALIEKKTRFIELLKEKRQALITQAVTKGLNPSVPMKHSGVEWIGEVPAHWETTRVGWIATYLSYGFTNPMPTTDDGPHMLTANDVGDMEIRWDTCRRTSENAWKYAITNKSRPIRNDILITKDGTLGRIGISDGRDCCINQSVALLRVNQKKALPEFVAYALAGSTYQERMIYEAGGTTIKHIYISRLAHMPFAIPPIEEQRAILLYARAKAQKVVDAMNQTQRSIDLLKERRSALITAAVTGQIDLREDAA